MTYWDKVKELEGRTLKTLDHEKKFDILAVSNKGVIVKPLSTGKERKVPRDEIDDGAYRELASNKEITRTTIEAKFSPRNPVYVAAILAELPGVRYKIRPIRLWLS